MRAFVIGLLVMLGLAQAPQPASAESKVSLPLLYMESEPERFAEAAFSEPYGRLLVAEFAASLRDGTYGECVKTKRTDPAAFADSVRILVVRHGGQLARKYAATIDRAAFKANFAALASADAETELVRLRDDKDVRAFLEIGAPLRHATVVNTVIEMIDRYLLIRNIKIRGFNPISTGNEQLLKADPSEATLDKLDDFVTSSKSSSLARYIELTQAAQEALNQSIDAKMLLGYRIIDLVAGLDKDLASLCFKVQ